MSRFDKSLIVAIMLHGCGLLLCRLSPNERLSVAPVAQVQVLSVELLTIGTTGSEGAARAEPSEDTVEHGRITASSTAPVRTRTESSPTQPPGAAQGTSTIAASEVVAVAGRDEAVDAVLSGDHAAAPGPIVPTAPSTGKIDLGLESRSLALPAAKDVPESQQRRSNIQQVLEADLLAKDVERGMARGGVLVDSMNRAVRTHGPMRGKAAVAVTLDAQGSVSAVDIVSGNEIEWASVLRAFRSQAGKRARIPPGARGLRVVMQVAAKVQRVSGADSRSGAVALDPIPLSGQFDVADLSGVVQRLAYVRIVSEQVL